MHLFGSQWCVYNLKKLAKIVTTFSYLVVTPINFRDWVLIYLNIDKMCTYGQHLLFMLTCTGSRAGKDSLKALLSSEAGLKSPSSWDKPSAQIFFLWLLSQGGGRLWFQLVMSTFFSHLPRTEASTHAVRTAVSFEKQWLRGGQKGFLEFLSCASWHIACHGCVLTEEPDGRRVKVSVASLGHPRSKLELTPGQSDSEAWRTQ